MGREGPRLQVAGFRSRMGKNCGDEQVFEKPFSRED
jgi:hypothetical protein